MRKIVVSFVTCVAASAWAIMPEVKNFRAPVQTPREVVKDFVWVEAEGFADYGEWRLDTQFVHKMGSGYLLAAGVLKPLGKATTRLNVPSAGRWTVWARTKDWLPEFHPGTFRVWVGDKPGATLGANGRDGWCWEKAGTWDLAAGAVDVALEDLTGAFARCDALLFTRDGAYVPPDEAEACAAARAKFTGADLRVTDCGDYDFVVVGAGTGGISAALAAARHGAKVALVHDRPVLGGNASCELGVPTDGAAISHAHAREGGLCEEANLARVGTQERTFSAVFREMAAKLPNLTVFANARVTKVEKQGERIAAVIARSTLTGKLTRYRGTLFLDGTGDGWIGYFAGAKLLYGREGKDVYNEWPAPEKGDDMLMSGCLMGNYLGYRHRSAGTRPVPYTTPVWARVLPEGFIRWTRNADSQWWVEHSGRFNELVDPERARDELFRINLAYWGWLKNAWKNKDQIASHELYEMAHMNGRREGYRILGDYVLTGNDCLAGRMFEDRISYGGWPLDRHDPEGMENPTGNGYCKHHPNVPIYSIPFRILYSVNVPNLMMAGRNVSVSHVALGSVRVEATIMTLGQAVGTAVPQMLKKGLTPREYGADPANIRALQQLLLKDDQYIPGLVNEDVADLARGAQVTASSRVGEFIVPQARGELLDLSLDAHPLNMPRATCFARNGLATLGVFKCWLSSKDAAPGVVTAVVFEGPATADGPRALKKLGEVKATVPAGSDGFVTFSPATPIPLAAEHVWIQLRPAKGLSWRLMGRHDAPDARRAYGDGKWTIVEGIRYAGMPAEGFREAIDAKPEYVIDGISRPIGVCRHGWISDPAQKLPQSLTLTFREPTRLGEVRITFDSDLNPLHPANHPKTLARDYDLEGLVEGKWVVLASVEGNLLRHRIHRFDTVAAQALRVTVSSTWGDPCARIFEIRAYANAAEM